MTKKNAKKKANGKNNGGRPTKYKAEYADQACKLCLLGATDEEMGDFFGVTEKTINLWKKAHPRFLQSIRRGKMQADAEVADKLFQRAKGYEHPEDRLFNIKGKIKTKRIVKHYPPDTAAAIIWLKNRTRKQKNSWRDSYEHDVSGDINVKVVDYSDGKPKPNTTT